MIYKELRIQHDGDGAEIDVVEIRLQRQTLKRAPPFAGCNDGAISPFICRLWLQIRIAAQMLVTWIRYSDSADQIHGCADRTSTPRNKSLKVGA